MTTDDLGVQSRNAADDSSADNHGAIFIPVFDDWASLAKLLPEINRALRSARLRGRVTAGGQNSLTGVDRPAGPCQAFEKQNISRYQDDATRRGGPAVRVRKRW
jgi:hypothetical protein